MSPGRQLKDQKLWRWEGGFPVPSAAQVSEDSRCAGAGGQELQQREGQTQHSQNLQSLLPQRGRRGEGNPCKQSHISPPSVRGSSASAARPDSAAGSQGWAWSSIFVPACLKQFLVCMADAEPKICVQHPVSCLYSELHKSNQPLIEFPSVEANWSSSTGISLDCSLR